MQSTVQEVYLLFAQFLGLVPVHGVVGNFPKKQAPLVSGAAHVTGSTVGARLLSEGALLRTRWLSKSTGSCLSHTAFASLVRYGVGPPQEPNARRKPFHWAPEVRHASQWFPVLGLVPVEF